MSSVVNVLCTLWSLYGDVDCAFLVCVCMGMTLLTMNLVHRYARVESDCATSPALSFASTDQWTGSVGDKWDSMPFDDVPNDESTTSSSSCEIRYADSAFDHLLPNDWSPTGGLVQLNQVTALFGCESESESAHSDVVADLPPSLPVMDMGLIMYNVLTTQSVASVIAVIPSSQATSFGLTAVQTLDLSVDGIFGPADVSASDSAPVARACKRCCPDDGFDIYNGRSMAIPRIH